MDQCDSQSWIDNPADVVADGAIGDGARRVERLRRQPASPLSPAPGTAAMPTHWRTAPVMEPPSPFDVDLSTIGADAGTLEKQLLAADNIKATPRHRQLRSRIADRSGVLSPSRLDESWGRRDMEGEGTRGSHHDTVHVAKLAPAAREMNFAMRGSLGPRGTYKGFAVKVRGMRPSTGEKRLGAASSMEELAADALGNDEFDEKQRRNAYYEKRAQRRLKKSFEWQETVCDSRRHRIAPAGGMTRRSPDLGPMRSTHSSYGQLERDIKDYRDQLPPVTPGVAAMEAMMDTPPLFFDQGMDGSAEKSDYGGWGGTRADWVMTMKPLPSDVNGDTLKSRPTTTATSRASRSRKQAQRSRLRASQELSPLDMTPEGGGSGDGSSTPGSQIEIVRRYKYGQPQSSLLNVSTQATTNLQPGTCYLQIAARCSLLATCSFDNLWF